MSEIISVKSIQVLDSRGNPTVEAEVTLKEGTDRKSTRLNLQSHSDLVCRLLLEKKKTIQIQPLLLPLLIEVAMTL